MLRQGWSLLMSESTPTVTQPTLMMVVTAVMGLHLPHHVVKSVTTYSLYAYKTMTNLHSVSLTLVPVLMGKLTTFLIAENDDDLTFISMFPNGSKNVITLVINNYPVS